MSNTLLRTKPVVKYCGLTLVLSFPSRFDTARLLSANGGQFFNTECLRPEFNVMQCDIRLAEDKSPFLDGTKVVLLLGDVAMHTYLPQTKNNSIGEMRGSVFEQGGKFYIPTFFPQDAVDMKNYESTHNPLYVDADEDENEWDSDKRHGVTSRKNYPFWLKQDCKKVKHLLIHGKIPDYPKPTYHIRPSSSVVIQTLLDAKDRHLYFDIETDYAEQNLQCFAFSVDGTNYYSVPILDNNYKPAYSDCPYILGALATAIQNNILVAHNGAAFDFVVLAKKYRIPINKVYDTMLAQHRCYPSVEKSLGHCVSLWTWEKFHKDEDAQGYMTTQQMFDRLKYCAKDVYTMYLVHKGIEEFAKKIPGLQHSIDTCMAAIRPYLIMSLQGIRYDDKLVAAKRHENDRLMEQYLRLLKFFIGEDNLKEIRGKGKSAMPGSNPQCCTYFHKMLDYPIVARGKPSKKDGERHPSLAKQALFKLRLQHDNPVIDICIAYRQVALETSTPLGFIPWRDDDNKIINRNEYIKKQNIQTINQSENTASSDI